VFSGGSGVGWLDKTSPPTFFLEEGARCRQLQILKVLGKRYKQYGKDEFQTLRVEYSWGRSHFVA